MRVDKIYVICLDGDKPEKQEEIASKLDALNLEGSTPFEIVKAFDGRDGVMPEGCRAYPGWNLGENTWNDWWKRPVLPGEIGCAYSHYMIWESIANNPEERVLILEEDFWSVKPMRELSDLNLPDWDMAVIGRWPFEEGNEERINEGWVYPKEYYNSHAYILTKSAANKIISSYPLFKQNLIPSDELLVATFMPHRREDIRNMFPPILNAIASDVEFITQKRGLTKSTIELERPELKPLETDMHYEILDDSNWDAWKAKYLNHTIAKGEYDLMVDDLTNNIYEFQLFTEKFCKEAIALAESMDKWTMDRHKFYPTNDVLLPEIGLDKIYNRVLQEVIYPMCIHLWTLEGEGWRDMVSENFLARYTTDRQSHLSLHHDFSHVTMVVKLNDEFDGGGTWFPKYKILSNPKQVGTATLHPGMVTHLHGARPIYAGKRYICVSFMRNLK
jgi:GR25 family glycosyltransferase involved in LPS biosynthesis